VPGVIGAGARNVDPATRRHYDGCPSSLQSGVDANVALDVVGKLARVTADITPGHLGEVMIEVRQGTERFLARASDSGATIHKHTQVVVVGSLGGRTVEVEPTDTLRLSG
jgi:hypothetical protein